MDDLSQNAETRCRDVHGSNAPEEIRALFSTICPQLSDHSINFVFGEVYAGMELSLAERELLNVVALVVEGSRPQLENHILAAYRVGCSPKKIIAAIVQMIIIIGFPRVVNSVLLAQQVFNENDILIDCK